MLFKSGKHDGKGTGKWTKRLIKTIGAWVECNHRMTNYFLTQVLMGHESFSYYLNRFKLRENAICRYCEVEDTTGHAIFKCSRWQLQTLKLEMKSGKQFNPDMVEEMLLSKEKWRGGENTVVNIMKQKEKEEREEQGAV